MLKLVATLLRNGHAYATRGHVLFDVSSYPRYGELANRSREGMLDGARVEVADYKRNPGDFVLWKPSEPEPPRLEQQARPWPARLASGVLGNDSRLSGRDS